MIAPKRFGHAAITRQGTKPAGTLEKMRLKRLGEQVRPETTEGGKYFCQESVPGASPDREPILPVLPSQPEDEVPGPLPGLRLLRQLFEAAEIPYRHWQADCPALRLFSFSNSTCRRTPTRVYRDFRRASLRLLRGWQANTPPPRHCKKPGRR